MKELQIKIIQRVTATKLSYAMAHGPITQLGYSI